MTIEVLHGFEPYARGIANRDLVARYRHHDLAPARVTRRERIGEGCVMRAPISGGRLQLGRTTVAAVAAHDLLDRLTRNLRPKDLAEATFTAAMRALCRDAITVLGPHAAILHAIHGAPRGGFDLEDLR